MNHKQLAQSIMELVGGNDNINTAIHCSTRLRLTLKNPDLAKTAEIKNLDGVIGAVNSGGQYQVIIGNDVGYVYNELAKMVDTQQSSEVLEKKKADYSPKGLFNTFASVIAGIFQPIIPAIAASGMLKALLLLATVTGLMSKESQTYTVLSVMSDAAFYFLPVLLAYSSANKFKTNPFVAVLFAGIMLHPNMIGLLGGEDPVSFIGLPVASVQYASSVVPIILTVWFMSYIERFADKVSPGPVKIFLKPLIVILIVAPIALIVLGPLGMYLGTGMSNLIYWIQDKIGWLTVVIMAILMPLIVMFGMHKVFYPIIFAALASPGYETLVLVAMLASNMAQGAGSLAVSFKSKDVKLKQVALSAGISGVFGITEPALYGVHLRLKKTLFACMIGAGIGGLFAGIVNLKAYAAVGPGIASMPMFISEDNMNIIYAIITMLISSIIAFIAVYVIGFQDVVPAAVPATDSSVAKVEVKPEIRPSAGIKSKKMVFAPLEGTVLSLREVKDEAFSQEAMGQGMAIQPSIGKVFAPFDGTVETVFRTKHSIGLRSVDGVELLIHVGLDTVKLKGQHFDVKVTEGEPISHGQLLMEFDLAAIQAAGYDTTTPVIVTNSSDYLEVLGNESSPITGPEKPLITVL
ncbi:beta-glucoside-specific PTS transporter subunit IIABC [Paenibacillus sp. OK076]|uniref:beta-glucoside-specific PTS transporter subunit IIABC n=1 Tax=Paenibacillus sp. OK076 TaxID=1884379 RepID=UPI0008B96E8C|nr:beta-glucoside-specific PTS transporter subunit IIABC [Paenibacillus sp. OK076]SEN97485.1 PTS system beta-glucoside-specific IIA component, Glc family /PTS system beta-glucoside-specific IIB component, Glc family /PTS system beta-glucoside-specific IIC component, Glc family [Paenibacillus sp. OK076]